MPPAADDHGSVELKMGHYLLVQGEMRGLGKAECGDVGIILWRNPDRLVGADDVFIASGSLPVRRSLEGYLETIPDLVAEIRSKNDTLPECLEKIRDYHKAGVKVVWLIDPRARSVTAYRPGAPPQVFGENDILTVEDIIPGFHVVVRELFK